MPYKQLPKINTNKSVELSIWGQGFSWPECPCQAKRNIERVEFLVTQTFTTPDRQKGWKDEKTSVTSVLVKGSMKNWTGSKCPFAEFTWFCCSPQPHMFSVFIAVVRMAPCLLRNVVRSQKPQLWGQVASCFPDCLCYQCCLPRGHVRLLRPALCCPNQFPQLHSEP